MTELCTNYMACQAFRDSHASKNDACSGCDGDLTRLRLVIDAYREAIFDLADVCATSPPELAGDQIITRINEVHAHLESNDVECSKAAVALGMQHQSLQTIHALRAAARSGRRRR